MAGVGSTVRAIWGKVRSGFSLPGGNHRAPQTPSPTDHCTVGGGGGEEDYLSALPDDVLLLVLLRLPSAAAAARTSVLSRRWRRLWARLPELRFLPGAGCVDRARTALAGHEAPALRVLFVDASGADPGHVVALLLLAAPRVTGLLYLSSVAPAESGAGDGGAVDLPCFEKAEMIFLELGYLALALPPAGVFANLLVLFLKHIRFLSPCDLGDTLSSARCRCLHELIIDDTEGLCDLTIHSESLTTMDLHGLDGLQELTIVAPMLRSLTVGCCFGGRRPVANISAPALKILLWRDMYDSNSVHLSQLADLQVLGSFSIVVYEEPDYPYNWDSVMLLQRFQKIPLLDLLISYPDDLVNLQYLMGTITSLPDTDVLQLGLLTRGHTFGHCVFHLLRVSTRIRGLKLVFRGDIKAETACTLGCVCDEPHDWETEELFLNFLEEVEISQLRGGERELKFLKRLLSWATVLKTISLTFHPSVTVSEEICEELLGLCRPKTCMTIS